MPVIGYLSSATPAANIRQLPPFRAGLKETGWDEGQNVAVEYRWAEDRYDRLPALAADLVGRKVDVIVSTGGITGALAAKMLLPRSRLSLSAATIRSSVVWSSVLPDRAAIRLQLLSELVPDAKVMALLIDPNNASAERVTRGMQEAARVKGVQLRILSASTESEIDAVFAAPLTGALVVSTDPYFYSRRRQLVTLASSHAVPAIYERREFPAEGGLISHGPSFTATWRQLGIYAGKILYGANPADLPVELPTTFELVVNLKTDKALGLTVPPSILARATEVIE
jgi:putative ABC transport system substrate-binding protein